MLSEEAQKLRDSFHEEEVEYTSAGTVKNWIGFIISLTVMILLLMFWSEFFWVALPFTLTFLVFALKVA